MELKRILVVTLLLLACGAVAYSQDSAALVTEAKNAFLARKFALAESKYRKAIESTPSFAAAHLGLVRTLLQAGKVSDAREAANEARKLLLDSADALVAHGEVAFREANFDSAMEAFQKALSLDPKRARALWGIGRLLQSESRYRTAKRFLTRAHELDPDDPDIIRSWIDTVNEPADWIAGADHYLSRATYANPFDLDQMRASMEFAKVVGKRDWFRPVDPKRPYVIRLGAARDTRSIRGYFVRASFNGSRPLLLLVDTGASGIVLQGNKAERLKVPIVAPLPLRGAGDEGQRKVQFGVVDVVRVGDLELRDCPVKFFKTGALAGLDGIIGTDAFAGFLVTFDRRAAELNSSRLRMQARPSRSGNTIANSRPPVLTLFAALGILLIETLANGHRGHFLVDSGSTANFVSTPLAKRIAPTRDADVPVRGISGDQKNIKAALNVKLEFAGFHQQQTGILAFDLSGLGQHLGAEVSGVLGMDVLDQLIMEIDYRNGYLRLTRAKN